MTDEQAIADVRHAVVMMKGALAHFEGKSTTMQMRMMPIHTLANNSLILAEQALGLATGDLGAHPYDGTPKK